MFNITEPETQSAETSNDVIVGIDLGTTNSLIAFKDEDKVVFCTDKDDALIPSVVYYSKDSEPLVGRDAALNPTAFRSIKRYMGQRPEKAAESKAYTHNADDKVLRFNSPAGHKTPTEISAEILLYLKKLAENTLGKPVTRAVITVPAYFDKSARQATYDAARLAGLEVVRMLSEPTAAAIAYGFKGEQNGTYAVYDLGGGTFDISILRAEKGILQVLATGGDTELGGDDFDAMLLEHLVAKHKNKVINYSEALQQCKLIKEALSTKEAWQGAFANLESIEVTREEFEAITTKLIDKTLDIFKGVLRDAGIKLSELTEVILVGGATRMKKIKEMIGDFCGKLSIDYLDVEKVVAMGAALQAHNLQSSNSDLLLDVTPLSLKLELADEIAETIIPRNTPIPAFAAYNFTTQKDGQSGFVIHVLQGESPNVNGCKSLAKFELTGIPKLPAGAAKLEVAFQIDADGLLSVKAKELTTGIIAEVLVKPSYGLNEKEIAELLTKK
ncbi:MAG: hscA [Candidatus Midichloriaceae bacterium]|jgi:molecular chaperone HscA|nr:hscA [Candidatus Midichloriaceae bacterium]